MLYLLDTDTSSYLIKGKHPQWTRLRERVLSIPVGEIAISALTKAELLYGLRRLESAADLQVRVDAFLGIVEVMDWPARASEFYAEIRHRLTSSGQLIGELDMLLAAQALAVDATLVTNNLRHFRRIHLPLRMENWVETAE